MSIALSRPVSRDGAALEGLLVACKAAWSLIDGSIESARAAVLAQLGRTAPPHVAWADYIATLHGADFFLASAAAAGAAVALSALRREHAATVERAVRSAGLCGAPADDVAARIWERVLVGSTERAPSIATYSGRGALGAWLHVSAVREAHLEQKERARFTSDGSLETMLGAAGDTELEYMKTLYAERFRSAFRKALASLPVRERSLLRYTYIDGLSAQRLAELYDVHRVSVARWLGEARDALAKETRRILARDLGLQDRDSESVMRLIQSRLDMSLSALALEA